MVKLTDAIQVGKLTFDNRMVMPPMATRRNEDGTITDELVQYYADRAGKIGMITTEHIYVSAEGLAHKGQISICKDEDIEGLKRITDAIHAKGITKVFAQISHAGTAGGYEVKDDADIKRITEAFASAALRAVKAGYDGVEIHCAHGYLLNQFYSPKTNHRTGLYGGDSLEGRTRFAVEVIHAVRNAVGSDFPISIRFGTIDDVEGGSVIDDAPFAAKLFEEAGVDMISVSGGVTGYIIKGNHEPGWFKDVSKAIKDAVTIPVLLTGGIKSREDADALLAENVADMIGVGRAIFADASVIGTILA